MNDDKKELRESLEDRLVEQGLGDILKSKSPPELSAKVAQQHAASLATPLASPLTATAKAPLHRPWRTTVRYAVAACLMLATGVFGFLLGSYTGSANQHKPGAVANANREVTEPTIDEVYFSNEESTEVGASSHRGVDMALASAPPLDPVASPGPRPTALYPTPGPTGYPRSTVSHPYGNVAAGEGADGGGAYPGTAGEKVAKLGDKVAEVRVLKGIHKDLSKLELEKNNEDRGVVQKSPEVLEKKLEDVVELRTAATALQDERRRIQQELREKTTRYTDALARGDKSEKLLKELEEVQVEWRDLPAAIPPLGQGEGPEHRGANFDHITENAFLRVKEHALSTFSIDVDTAAYSIMRRMIQGQQLPPAGAVRIEEYLNYFSYNYAGPKGEDPFAANVEVAACPWNGAHRLVRVGLKGKEIALDKRPASNLVFLLDVSGSMDQEKKLPLVKESMRLLLDRLGENDRVAIVVYAGAAGLVLPSTTADKKSDILAALDKLHAGGSTNGAQGIELAYQTASEHFLKGGTNRVILCTDGDFNVGTTSHDALQRMAEEKAKTGVFLSVLGFGMDNLQDKTLETIADKGNGNYGYIDTLAEANKVFGQQLTGTLITIAKDVKIQIEFNPAQVAGYRLIGYENRMLAAQDFNDDKKDAGEIGAGHTVTALYEVVPFGAEAPAVAPSIDKLKYQVPGKLTDEANAGELMTLKLRYKQPDGDKSKLLEFPVKDEGKKFGQASDDFRFASAVAAYGMLLRRSEHSGNATFAAVAEIAEAAKGTDAHGYRAEFLELVKKTQQIWR